MNKKYRYGICALAFLAIVLVIKGILSLTINSTYAKYSDDSVYQHYLKTKKVYFESSSLKNDYIVTNNYNYENITFDIKNGNGNLITSTSVDYTLSCSVDNDDYECILDDDSDTITGTFVDQKGCYNGSEIVDMNQSTCLANEYVWDYIINTENHTIKLVNNGSSDRNTVTSHLLFQTTSGYNYELEGDFVFNITPNFDRDVIKYDFTGDISNMCLLKLTNLYDVNKSINVSFSSLNYYFDNSVFSSLGVTTNSVSGVINDIDITVNGNTSAYLNMYSKDGTCTKSDIAVIANN